MSLFFNNLNTIPVFTEHNSVVYPKKSLFKSITDYIYQ